MGETILTLAAKPSYEVIGSPEQASRPKLRPTPAQHAYEPPGYAEGFSAKSTTPPIFHRFASSSRGVRVRLPRPRPSCYSEG